MKNNTLQNIQRRFYTILVAWGIVLAVIIGFFVLPSFFSIKNLRAQTVSLTDTAKTVAQQQSDLIALSRNERDIDTKIRYVQKFFLNETSLLPFIQELENLAQSHHTTLNISLSDDAKKTTSFSDQTFSLSLNGDWNDILTLLYDTEQTYPQMTIQSLAVSPNDVSPNSITVTVTATVPAIHEDKNL